MLAPDGQLMAIDELGSGQGSEQFVGHRRRAASAGDLRQQDRELVPTEPGERVFVAQACPQAPGDGDQYAVADVMPEAVVDDFEAIQVKEEDRQRTVPARSDRQPLFEPVVKQRSVGQAGQRVGVGQVPQVALKLLAF